MVSQDVLKGTRLLVTDVVVAITLIKRRAAGHNFTERERKLLHRTCADLVSVIPIGFLMLLPVGHVYFRIMLLFITLVLVPLYVILFFFQGHCSWACSYACSHSKICSCFGNNLFLCRYFKFKVLYVLGILSIPVDVAT